MVQQAARDRNFFGATRRAFLGDGLAANWTLQRRHFTSFTPILDFVHALSYVFAAAFAGRSLTEGQAIYKKWIQAVWAGQVATILTELEARSTTLGSPPSECAESDPRKLVSESLRYLTNNADRMKYDQYRGKGLPIMTSAVESAIKMINKRVKGSEKFWSGPGAEAILQLRADYLSETEPMSRFWLEREAHASIHRPRPPRFLNKRQIQTMSCARRQFPGENDRRALTRGQPRRLNCLEMPKWRNWQTR